MKMSVVAFCAVLLAAPAVANEPGTAGGTGGAASNPAGSPESATNDGAHAPDMQRQICRTMEGDSASRLGPRRTRVCRTAEEWREAERRN